VAAHQGLEVGGRVGDAAVDGGGPLDRAGFAVLEEERLREPSSKYTLRAFLAAKGGRA